MGTELIRVFGFQIADLSALDVLTGTFFTLKTREYWDLAFSFYSHLEASVMIVQHESNFRTKQVSVTRNNERRYTLDFNVASSQLVTFAADLGRVATRASARPSASTSTSSSASTSASASARARGCD